MANGVTLKRNANEMKCNQLEQEKQQQQINRYENG